MNNAIYGKTMKKLKNRNNVKLVNNKKDYLKCISKPSYMSHNTFDNNLVAMHKRKLALKLKKPVYIGMCFLGISKALIYELNYDYIKNKYENKSKLLFTGTDSGIYEIKTEDVYEGFNSDK